MLEWLHTVKVLGVDWRNGVNLILGANLLAEGWSFEVEVLWISLEVLNGFLLSGPIVIAPVKDFKPLSTGGWEDLTWSVLWWFLGTANNLWLRLWSLGELGFLFFNNFSSFWMMLCDKMLREQTSSIIKPFIFFGANFLHLTDSCKIVPHWHWSISKSSIGLLLRSSC